MDPDIPKDQLVGHLILCMLVCLLGFSLKYMLNYVEHICMINHYWFNFNIKILIYFGGKEKGYLIIGHEGLSLEKMIVGFKCEWLTFLYRLCIFLASYGTLSSQTMKPFLFLLMIEGLVNLMQEVVSKGMFKGIKVEKMELTMTRL